MTNRDSASSAELQKEGEKNGFPVKLRMTVTVDSRFRGNDKKEGGMTRKALLDKPLPYSLLEAVCL